uniref:Suco-1 n=1 Tax=Pristionchus pacificus TaxID=54126 RepID=A0A8R1YEG3_PRIPA
MSRPKRFSVSLDGDPRGQSCSRSLVPVLLLTSLFFASSAAVLSCPADGGPCSPMDLRAALNRSRHSFATCDAAAQPPSQTPPAGTQQPDPAAAAADPAAMRSEELTKPPVVEYAETRTSARSAELPDAAAAAAAAEPAPQIATFDEWTKAKLQQPPPVIVVAGSAEGAPTGATAPHAAGHAAPETPRVLVAVPPLPAHPAAATRNYASRECGAKVIYSNPEAENTKAVLNDKEKDDYMRNPCDKAQHKHIVIELCETIQPRSIEIANFELFSSGPAAVRFSAAERFPTQQWSVLGEWSLADTRTVQTLPVAADALTYAKFIKLELLAHHGAEHFCTLSTVRVLGVSMVDEYEAEAAVAARIAAPHAAVPPLTATEAVVTPPRVQHTQPKEQQQQQQQVKKEEPPQAAVPTESTPITSTEAPPIAVVEPPPVAPRPPASDASPPASGSGLVQDVMSGTLLKKIIEVVGGGKKKTADAPAAPPRLSAYDACDRTPTDGWPRATCARRAFFCPPGTTPAPAAARPSHAEETAAKRAAARRQFIAATQREEAARAAAAAPPPQLPHTQIDAPPQRKATTTPVVQPQAAAPTPPVAEAAPKEAEPPVAAAKPQQEQQPPPAAAAPPAAQQQQAAPPVGIFEGLPAGTNSHKLETIFIKLTKRVSALELNMSLSSEYLSELSKQYIAHTDEQKRAMERTRVAAERAALDVARTVNETVRDELFNLRKEVDALSAWLATLRAQAGSVALTRRISGAYAAPQDGHHETSPAEERPSSAEVGHHRRHQTVDIGGEDYASYEEAYESTCPYSEGGGRRQPQQGRPYGPQPRPPREPNASDADDGEEEEGGHADADDAFDLRHFRHHSDGIWTTEQVLYAVLGAQALTVALVLLMQACYARAFGRGRQPADPPAPAAVPAPDTAELERLIAAALERRAQREAAPPRVPVAAAAAASADASPRSSASSTASSSGAAPQPLQQLSGGKKKRRQRRSTAEQQQQQQQNHHHCRQCGEGQNLDWDSAMDSSLPSPSQTGSEEEFEAPPPSAGSAPSSPQAAPGSSIAKPESSPKS